MDEAEKFFWLGLAGMSGFVLMLLVIGPLSRAFNSWKTKMAFRARKRAAMRPRKNSGTPR
jgi:hypothetical protein